MNPETNNQNVNNSVGANAVNTAVPSQPVQSTQTVVNSTQPAQTVKANNVVQQPAVTNSIPVSQPTTNATTVAPSVSPQVASSSQESAVVTQTVSEPVVQPNEPVMSSTQNLQKNEAIEVMPNLTSTLQTPVVNTVVAPSKIEQTIITDNIEGMAQVSENATPVENTLVEETAPVDNGIREEVKLDMSVAMEGVPTIDNANVAEAIPTQETKTIEEISTQTEVNTQKKKTSNTIIVIILLIIAACTYFMDDIMSYFNTTVLPMIKNDVKEEETSGNLIDGYIKLGDPSSFMKMSGIKFYNFTINEQNKVIFSYLSDKKMDSTDSLGYYIVFYNNDKEITYKELFSSKNKIEKSEVNQYKITVDADVYQDSKYAKIIKYSDDELQKKYKITCTYTRDEADNIKLRYENVYSFENDLLISYSITKEYTLPTEETQTSKVYKNELDNENTKISGVGIKTEYKDNKLFYTVNLNNLPDGFIPLYKNTATKAMIVKKENLKKWECK